MLIHRKTKNLADACERRIRGVHKWKYKWKRGDGLDEIQWCLHRMQMGIRYWCMFLKGLLFEKRHIFIFIEVI